MTNEELQLLDCGDKVYWTDPDDESESDCSRVLVIGSIEINGDVVTIMDIDGYDFECLAEELSHGCKGDGCKSRGYDEWELGPDDGSHWCCDCVSKYYPLKSVPQEWIIDRD